MHVNHRVLTITFTNVDPNLTITKKQIMRY